MPFLYSCSVTCAHVVVGALFGTRRARLNGESFLGNMRLLYLDLGLSSRDGGLSSHCDNWHPKPINVNAICCRGFEPAQVIVLPISLPRLLGAVICC